MKPYPLTKWVTEGKSTSDNPAAVRDGKNLFFFKKAVKKIYNNNQLQSACEQASRSEHESGLKIIWILILV